VAAIGGFAASKAFAANHRLKAGWAFEPAGDRQVEEFSRQVEFFRAMHAKSRQSADRPWRAVAPNPPDRK
jgi:hypothetical protein